MSFAILSMSSLWRFINESGRGARVGITFCEAVSRDLFVTPGRFSCLRSMSLPEFCSALCSSFSSCIGSWLAARLLRGTLLFRVDSTNRAGPYLVFLETPESGPWAALFASIDFDTWNLRGSRGRGVVSLGCAGLAGICASSFLLSGLATLSGADTWMMGWVDLLSLGGC